MQTFSDRLKTFLLIKGFSSLLGFLFRHLIFSFKENSMPGCKRKKFYGSENLTSSFSQLWVKETFKLHSYIWQKQSGIVCYSSDYHPKTYLQSSGTITGPGTQVVLCCCWNEGQKIEVYTLVRSKESIDCKRLCVCNSRYNGYFKLIIIAFYLVYINIF